MGFQDEAKNVADEVKVFSSTHGKVTAIIVAVVVGLVVGFFMFH
jgi:hypothetical protein